MSGQHPPLPRSGTEAGSGRNSERSAEARSEEVQSSGAPSTKGAVQEGTKAGTKGNAKGGAKGDESSQKRQLLTVTSLYEAVVDLYRATLPQDRAAKLAPSLIIRFDETTKFAVTLWDEGIGSGVESHVAFSQGASVEDALAKMLEGQRDRVEAFKAERIASLTQVLDRHSGVIRGARSKIQRG